MILVVGVDGIPSDLETRMDPGLPPQRPGMLFSIAGRALVMA